MKKCDWCLGTGGNHDDCRRHQIYSRAFAPLAVREAYARVEQAAEAMRQQEAVSKRFGGAAFARESRELESSARTARERLISAERELASTIAKELAAAGLTDWPIRR